MKIKQLMLSLCLECVDIRHRSCSIYTIINSKVVYFCGDGSYIESREVSISKFKTLPRLTTFESVKVVLKRDYGIKCD